MFLASEERHATTGHPAAAKRTKWILGLTVIVTGLLKLLNRLEVIG